MSRSTKRSLRTTSVPPTAIHSGARVLDLFPLPMPLFLVWRFLVWLKRHWYLVAIVALYFFVDWRWSIAVLVGVPLMILGYVWLHNPRHGLLAMARAARRIALSKIKWRPACEAAGLVDGHRVPRLVSLRRPPRIANERGTAIEFTLNLSRIGQTVTELEQVKDYIAAVLNAQRTRVVRLTPGVARFVVEWGRLDPNSPRDAQHTTRLPMISLDATTQVAIELDTSLLVVGESGSGKSNLTWHMLNGLNAHNVPYKLHVIDPKKVELADLADSPFTVTYADSMKHIDTVIEGFHESMMRTFDDMKIRGTRKVEISEETPLNIMIIDELLMCQRQLRGGAVDTPLGEILSAGRAAGFIVVANSQLGQVDVIGRIRDLFPQRICMSVKSRELTEAVLGPRAEERGARCTEITEKGVGYVYTYHHGSFQRFRVPLISNTRAVAQGTIVSPEPARRLVKRA